MAAVLDTNVEWRSALAFCSWVDTDPIRPVLLAQRVEPLTRAREIKIMQMRNPPLLVCFVGLSDEQSAVACAS
jgi:hypothetical protein